MQKLLAFGLGVLIAAGVCWATRSDCQHQLALVHANIVHCQIMLEDTHEWWQHRLEFERHHFAPLCADVRTMTAPEMLWHIEDVLRQINLDGRTK